MTVICRKVIDATNNTQPICIFFLTFTRIHYLMLTIWTKMSNSVSVRVKNRVKYKCWFYLCFKEDVLIYASQRWILSILTFSEPKCPLVLMSEWKIGLHTNIGFTFVLKKIFGSQCWILSILTFSFPKFII